MRKYYVFEIQKRTYRNYEKKSSSLYTLLNRIRTTKKGEERSSYALYNQLCNTFQLENLYDYFCSKYQVRKKKRYYFRSAKEKYLIELNPSCIIILTENQFPGIFQILSYYHSNLFVCDFDNGDYFWLNEVLEKKC